MSTRSIPRLPSGRGASRAKHCLDLCLVVLSCMILIGHPCRGAGGSSAAGTSSEKLPLTLPTEGKEKKTNNLRTLAEI